MPVTFQTVLLNNYLKILVFIKLEIRNSIHEQLIKSVGEKQYFKFVQKVAQIAVKNQVNKRTQKLVVLRSQQDGRYMLGK